MHLPLLLAAAALTTAAPVAGLLDGLTSKLNILKDTLSQNNGDVGSLGNTGNIGQVLGDLDTTIAQLVNTGDITGVGELNAPVTVGDIGSGNDVSLVDTGDILGNVQLSDFVVGLLGDVDIRDVVGGLGIDASDLGDLDLGGVNTLSGFAAALGVSVEDLVNVLEELGIDGGSF